MATDVPNLSAMQRNTLLARLATKSHTEAAQRLKITPRAYRKRLSRAMAKLAADQRARYFKMLEHDRKRILIKPIQLSLVSVQ